MWPLSTAIISNYSNVLIFILTLSEGRTGEAWEPSNKTMLFLPPLFPNTTWELALITPTPDDGHGDITET
jgi:hypothetical protein